MLQLDGAELNLHDRVYDLTNGYGEVTDVAKDNFTVLFANRRRLTFDEGGLVRGVRRLFWHDPLILAPPKDAAEWQHLIRIVVSVQGLISAPPTP